MRRRKSLDHLIIESIIFRGCKANWRDIKRDLQKQNVCDKVLWDSLKRLESLDIIKKGNDKGRFSEYHFILLDKSEIKVYTENWQNCHKDFLLRIFEKYGDIKNKDEKKAKEYLNSMSDTLTIITKIIILEKINKL